LRLNVPTPQLFFLYVPLWVAGALAAAGAVAFQIRKTLAAQKEEKLKRLDESAIREILGAEDDQDAKGAKQKKDADHTKAKKAKAKVQQRLAQERKAENRSKESSSAAAATKKKGGNDEDDVDEDDLLMFAKGSRQAKSKKGQ
jgi:MprA protease rhombosortase-interaction domain-containing protein